MAEELSATKHFHNGKAVTPINLKQGSGAIFGVISQLKKHVNHQLDLVNTGCQARNLLQIENLKIIIPSKFRELFNRLLKYLCG